MSSICVVPVRAVFSSLLFLILSLSSMQALAARVQLQPSAWTQLVIPADPDGATIGELFLDDFAPIFPGEEDGGYNVGWVAYLYDPDTQDYVRPTSLDVVPRAGHAFWIIHAAPDPVTIDVPDSLPMASTGTSSTCVSAQGCFTLPLPDESVSVAGSAGERYALVGSPYPYDTVLTDLRFLTNVPGDPCLNGCSLAEAESQSYTIDVLWVWDGTTGAYRSVTSDSTPGVDVLPAWQGYWLLARQEAEDKAPTFQIPHSPQNATVSGRITTADGTPVSNATVTAEGVGLGGTVSSNTDGQFEFDLVASSEYTLTIDSGSHARQVKVVQSPVTGGSVTLDITVVETAAVFRFDAAEGGTFEGDQGASVVVQGGSFVTQSGALATGTLILNLSSVDVSNPALLAAFPGEFTGMSGVGAGEEAIYSLGTTNFEFTTDSGERVQLDASISASAEITLPIFGTVYQSGNEVRVGDRIALWSLNEETGIWLQEGEGIVVDSAGSPTGLALQATVSHFSWWNCDVTLDAVPVRIGVDASQSGTAIIEATTTGDLGWRPNTVDTVVSVGRLTPPLYVPGDREVCYSANINYDDGSFGSTDVYCATAPTESIVLSTVPGDFALVVSSSVQPVAGVRSITGYPGEPVERVAFAATTIETSVRYEIINGSLPAGVSLKPTGDTRAEISGVPDVGSAGTYEITVRGSNTEAESYQLDLTIIITDDVPAPALPASILAVINANFEQNRYQFANDNTGGPVNSWTLGGPALPVGATFDTITGEILIPYDLLFDFAPDYWDWTGSVTANGDSGSSTAAVTLRVDCTFCGPGDFPMESVGIDQR